MSVRENATPCAAELLAHLNLLLMAVGGACLWYGVVIMRSALMPALKTALGPVSQGAGVALVALGGAHGLLADLALFAAIRPSAGLFITHAVLQVAICCGEAGWLAWSVTTLRSLPADAAADTPILIQRVFLVFGGFLPGNQERLKLAVSDDPLTVYLTLGGALALPLLQLAGCVAALCAAQACRRAASRDTRDTRHPRDTHHQLRDSFQYHRYDGASTAPQYQ